METDIKDIDGHLLCKADSATGTLKNVYHKQIVLAKFPVGGEMVIQRRGIRTHIKRLADGKFYAYGMHMTAAE